MIKQLGLVAALAPLPALAERCDPPPPPPACADPFVVTLGDGPTGCQLASGQAYVIRMPADEIADDRCAQIAGELDWTFEDYAVTGHVACWVVHAP